MTEKTNTGRKTCGALDPGLRRDDDRGGHWGTRGKVPWGDIKNGAANAPSCITYSNPAVEYKFERYVMFLLLLPFILFAHIYPHLVEHCETVVAYTHRQRRYMIFQIGTQGLFADHT